MKTNTRKLTPAQAAILSRCITKAVELDFIWKSDGPFQTRARAAFLRNLAEPGDCANDSLLLAALAVAEAEVGMSPGWIPEVQRVGCAIASALEKK